MQWSFPLLYITGVLPPPNESEECRRYAAARGEKSTHALTSTNRAFCTLRLPMGGLSATF